MPTTHDLSPTPPHARTTYRLLLLLPTEVTARKGSRGSHRPTEPPFAVGRRGSRRALSRGTPPFAAGRRGSRRRGRRRDAAGAADGAARRALRAAGRRSSSASRRPNEHVAEERRHGTQHGAEEQWRDGCAEGMSVRTKRYEVVTPLENIMDMEPLRIWMNSMSMST
ncbi:uncharacterized protein LOC125518871 [Triticum urartu]|uniref:uncharacterized protein LOC125518871 n=1 Tax=Triticum urartu TaxID=4572 RepID=UPI002044332D|nr:uncharacterized protein LOC125518871 [Triticum urartu]